MRQIVIATKNKGKIKEFEDFFKKYGIEVLSLYDLENNIPDIEETGSTFEENAALKAEQIAHILNKAVLADDSGLMVDALNGEPGIYSARYAGADKSDSENNNKLLKNLENVPEEKRTAKFVCTLAIARPGEETIFKTGYCHGQIGYSPKGEHGFGYDPLFIPNGYNKTMAELSPEEKNKISHRSEAIKQLDDWLKVLF
ncbi:XTP/dITP diphosphatase [Oceanobacillus sp. CAU 1775]